MAELADAPDLGSGVLDVGVRASLSAPSKREKFLRFFSFHGVSRRSYIDISGGRGYNVIVKNLCE